MICRHPHTHIIRSTNITTSQDHEITKLDVLEHYPKLGFGIQLQKNRKKITQVTFELKHGKEPKTQVHLVSDKCVDKNVVKVLFI